MAEKKSTTRKATARKAPARKTAAKSTPKAAAPKSAPAPSVSPAAIASADGALLKLGALKPAARSRPKRTRIGRGHGSGMVKTGGGGGKGQTVRSGGGKGPAFEGGQTAWARRLPHGRGYSQKGRDTGHFGSRLATVNLYQLARWDPAVEVSPESLRERGVLKSVLDGVKILGGSKSGKTVPSGLRFRDVSFSDSARKTLMAAGAAIAGDPSDFAARGAAEPAGRSAG
jgi:large subunit ribosomal protein L15